MLDSNGWTCGGPLPEIDKAVIIASPHTSNWDFYHMMTYMLAAEFQLRWMGKKELFSFPFGPMLRMSGGVPVNRSGPGGLVQSMVEEFENNEKLWLVVPPKGTRGASDYWKSGFYAIARAASVPILLSYLDYSEKRIGFGPFFHASDDISADMDRIREFYKDFGGKYPAKHGRIRLRAEDDDAAFERLFGYPRPKR